MTTVLASWEQGKVGIGPAWDSMGHGGSLLDALEAGLAACELDPALVAIGLGSLPNAEGEIELDASIMDGKDLSAGAVCAVRGIVPVISVARKVMEETPHILIAGDQARRFAIEHGFEPRDLKTPDSIARYEDWLANPESYERQYLHSLPEHGDTITMLAWRDSPSTCAAASSTSGRSWKLPGRVGDSPIVGAGIYADDEAGCAGATGLGEELWKAAASFQTVEHMRQGMSAQEACEETVRRMLRRQPESRENMCVVMALRMDGDYGAATTYQEFPMWVCLDGESEMRTYQPLGL
jgi:isoaspartyl peptidase/L-asparaginase-like protein (Ntn-hydrolase superfamily)